MQAHGPVNSERGWPPPVGQEEKELEEEPHVIWASSATERYDRHVHALQYSVGSLLGRGEISACWDNVLAYRDVNGVIMEIHESSLPLLYQMVCILSWGTKLPTFSPIAKQTTHTEFRELWGVAICSAKAQLFWAQSKLENVDTKNEKPFSIPSTSFLQNEF